MFSSRWWYTGLVYPFVPVGDWSIQCNDSPWEKLLWPEGAPGLSMIFLRGKPYGMHLDELIPESCTKQTAPVWAVKFYQISFWIADWSPCQVVIRPFSVLFFSMTRILTHTCCEYFTSWVFEWPVILAAMNKSFKRAIRIVLSITSRAAHGVSGFLPSACRTRSIWLCPASILNDRQIL